MENRNLLKEFTEYDYDKITSEHIKELKEWSNNFYGQLAVIHTRKLLSTLEYYINKKEEEDAK